MSYIKLLVYFVFLLTGIGRTVYATHMIGGDVVYRCLGNNAFEITITLFQDCRNGEPSAIQADNPAYYSIFNAANNILVAADSVYAVSTEYVDPNFSNACINNYPQTCMQKQVYRFVEILPPTTQGYTIVYERCCRNAAINNIQNPGNVGVTYFASIPPFSSGQCPNNSAVFKGMPPQIICSNNPFVYDFSATDLDADSLVYRLCAARPGGTLNNPKPYGNEMEHPIPASVNYLGAYSATMPVAGTPPIQINPITGLMTGTPISNGRFVVTVCVDEYRNGVRINTISRDVQFVITNCSKTVVANIPELPDEPNTFTVQCKGYNVQFVNRSTGGFSYFWDFGVNNATSTAFEPNFTYPDTGTYVVKLIVNAGSTCPDSIERLVKIYPEFHTDYDWTGLLCPDLPIKFSDSSKSTYPYVNQWLWDFGDGNTSTEQHPTHIFGYPGGEKRVTLIAKTTLGCRDTLSKILPLPFFDPNAGNDTIIVFGYDFYLNGTGAQYYSWSPSQYLSNGNIANPRVNFPDTGIYTFILTGSTETGCVGSDTIVIQVVKYPHIFVPNAFSPNGDGLNDFLMPVIIGYSKINTFKIFNRYGERVFNSTNNNYPKWDGRYKGKDLDVGVFYWIAEILTVNGTKEVRKGDITLLR